MKRLAEWFYYTTFSLSVIGFISVAVYVMQQPAESQTLIENEIAPTSSSKSTWPCVHCKDGQALAPSGLCERCLGD